MNLPERHTIADAIVTHLGKTAPEYGPSALGTVIASRIIAAITGVDALVLATQQPVLLAEALPGVDVIGVRDYRQPARTAYGSGSPLDGIWEEADIGNDWVPVLGAVVVDYLKEQARGVKGSGALSHSGQDGVYYFVFQSEFRAMALRQIGLTSAEVRIVQSGVTAGA